MILQNGACILKSSIFLLLNYVKYLKEITERKVGIILPIINYIILKINEDEIYLHGLRILNHLIESNKNYSKLILKFISIDNLIFFSTKSRLYFIIVIIGKLIDYMNGSLFNYVSFDAFEKIIQIYFEVKPILYEMNLLFKTILRKGDIYVLDFLLRRKILDFWLKNVKYSSIYISLLLNAIKISPDSFKMVKIMEILLTILNENSSNYHLQLEILILIDSLFIKVNERREKFLKEFLLNDGISEFQKLIISPDIDVFTLSSKISEMASSYNTELNMKNKLFV